MHTNVILLAFLQAAMMTSIGLLISISGIIGLNLASPGMSTVPLAGLYIGTLLTLYPAASGSQYYGRRVVFLIGAAFGICGAVVGALSLILGSFLGFVFSCVLLGVYNGVGQFYRFAAAESVAPSQAGRAISLTLTGGLLAAVVGPWLASETRLLTDPPFIASFTMLIGVACFAAVAGAALRPIRLVSRSDEIPRRPLAEILAQPQAILAIAACVIGYTVMNVVMTGMPLAVAGLSCSFNTAASVMKAHLVAMFLPSFVTGYLVERFGAPRMIVTGSMLLLVAFTAGALRPDIAGIWFGLVALGVGWNFTYVSGSTLLTRCYRPSERGAIQAINDALVFGSVAIGTFSAGPLVFWVGWQMANLLMIVPVFALLAVSVINGKAAMPLKIR